MVHNEIHAIDLAIIAAYLIAMVLIGLVVVKKVKSMDDYYLGGRSFGPLVLMATVCATIIGGQRPDGPCGRCVFQRLQGHHDGAAVSARDVYLLRLCRTYFRRRTEIQRHVHPGSV